MLIDSMYQVASTNKSFSSLEPLSIVDSSKDDRTRLMLLCPSKPSHILVKEVKVLIKAKLFGLDRIRGSSRPRRLQHSSSHWETYLLLWFRHFDS
ncbi:hypothetical protein Bca4012_050902 [Brassica carinata]|uniref:Uncharacterized protein n=1 Tax=Brassica cretica TaxID=69181 RepID=A0A8S9QPG0_BRACR|nr:hypothetical protein F2Q69_00021467 [Brassica cretica]